MYCQVIYIEKHILSAVLKLPQTGLTIFLKENLLSLKTFVLACFLQKAYSRRLIQHTHKRFQEAKEPSASNQFPAREKMGTTKPSTVYNVRDFSTHYIALRCMLQPIFLNILFFKS